MASAQSADGSILGAECRERIEETVRCIIRAVGEDVAGSGLSDTPSRVAAMYDELLAGYRVDPVALLNDALFDVDYDEMVVLRDIGFHSLCEHHLIPFFGRVHVGYLPAGRVVGLSKIPRLVDMFAHRLQVQERMTQQIAQFLDDLVHPHGVGVVIEATHLCAEMRGVKKPGMQLVTSAMLGGFRTRPATRQEFMALVGGRVGDSSSR